MSRLNPEKLHIRIIPPTSIAEPIIPRRYTLTHSDRTGELFLTIGPDYDYKQIRGWYTRLLRDEVLAEWQNDEFGYVLHVYCQIGRGLGRRKFREGIFRRELPLVLETFRFGDRRLFEKYPNLDRAVIRIHFYEKDAAKDKIEDWGKMSDYSLSASRNNSLEN